MNGFVIFYINFKDTYNKEEIESILNLVKDYNNEFVTKLRTAGYEVVFTPTVNEAARVEMFSLSLGKVDKLSDTNRE